MTRSYDNWITAYLQYNFRTESAVVFHKWAAIFAVGAVLRRKVYFSFGRIKVHPNLYIVLVAEPGMARKSQAISFMEEFLSDIYGIHIAADATTPQALLGAIEQAADDVQMVDGTSLRHCSLAICSGEFESFLGNKKENSKMITYLTDLFDCKSKPFTYNTKHSGCNVLPLPFLSIIAATTPGSISECFPASAIGGGLGSRILFVYAFEKARKEAIPELDHEKVKMYEPLLKDLSVISRMSGEFSYSKEGRQWWLDFYEGFEERDPNRLCKDPSFLCWYSRKPLLLLKVATIVSAAKRPDQKVTPEDFEEALSYIEEVEPHMSNAFSGVGRSDITADVDSVKKIIQRAGKISEKQLRQLVWRDIDDRKFSTVIDTITKAGEAKVGFDQNKEIWYVWNK